MKKITKLEDISAGVLGDINKFLLEEAGNVDKVKERLDGVVDGYLIDLVATDWKTKVGALKVSAGANKDAAKKAGSAIGIAESMIEMFWDDATFVQVTPNSPATVQDTSSVSSQSKSEPTSNPSSPSPTQESVTKTSVGRIQVESVPPSEPVPTNSSKRSYGWVWIMAIALIVGMLFLFKDCISNINIGRDNEIYNNCILIGGVWHKAGCDCDDCHAVRSGTVVTENGSKSSGNGTTSSGNNSGATKPSNNGNNASNNNGSGTSNTKPIPPTPPTKENPWKNPNPVNEDGTGVKPTPPEKIIPRDNGGNDNNPGDNPGGTNPGTNPGTDPGTTPGGGDTNPPPKDPPVQPPPEQPEPCPCATKLFGPVHERSMANIGMADGIDFDFKALFQHLIPSYLADDERFEIVLVYFEPDGSTLGHEIENYVITEAEQLKPLTKEMLTKTGYRQPVIKSRIQWFKEKIGAKFCADRFRIAVYNARTDRIYADGHYSFPF